MKTNMQMDNKILKEIFERITKLEVQVKEVIENHIPHLEARMSWILGLLITNLIALVFLLLKNKL